MKKTYTKLEEFTAWLHDEIEANPKLKDALIYDYYRWPLDKADYTNSEGECHAKTDRTSKRV